MASRDLVYVGIDPATDDNLKWTARLGSAAYGNPTISGGKVYTSSVGGTPKALYTGNVAHACWSADALYVYFIKNNGEMKTSAGVLEVLSDRLRSMCDQAIESARSDGRKTVLDRDFS